MDLRIVIFVAYCVVATSAMSWTKKHKKRSFMVEAAKNGDMYDGSEVAAMDGHGCTDELENCASLKPLCSKLRIVRKKCKDTCGRCKLQGPPIDCKLTQHGCCWDNTSYAKGPNQQGCPACENKFGECKFFKDQCHHLNVRKLCPVTCGVKCQTCHDNIHQALMCPMYKQYKFCKVSPVLMAKVCPRTCGFCV